MAINNAANIHIENTNSSLHYKQYITLHYKHYKLLTCLAAPLLGSRGEAAQSAVTREREEHADTGDLAAVDIGLQRSGIGQLSYRLLKCRSHQNCVPNHLRTCVMSVRMDSDWEILRPGDTRPAPGEAGELRYTWAERGAGQ